MSTPIRGEVSVPNNATHLTRFPEDAICLDESLENPYFTPVAKSETSKPEPTNSENILALAAQKIKNSVEGAWENIKRSQAQTIPTKLHVVSASAEKIQAAKASIQNSAKKEIKNTGDDVLNWNTAPWYHKAWMLPVGVLGAIACGGNSEEFETDGDTASGDTDGMPVCKNEDLESECTVTVLPEGDPPAKVWINGNRIPVIPIPEPNYSLYEEVCPFGGSHIYEYLDPTEQETLYTDESGIFFLFQKAALSFLEKPMVKCYSPQEAHSLDPASTQMMSYDPVLQEEYVKNFVETQVGQEVTLNPATVLKDQVYSYSFSFGNQQLGLAVYNQESDEVEYLWQDSVESPHEFWSVYETFDKNHLSLRVLTDRTHIYQGEAYGYLSPEYYFYFDMTDPNNPQALGKVHVPEANIYDVATPKGHAWADYAEMTVREPSEPVVVDNNEVWLVHRPFLNPYFYPELEDMGVGEVRGRATLSRFDLASGDPLGDTPLQAYVPDSSEMAEVAGTDYMAMYAYPDQFSNLYIPNILLMDKTNPEDVSNIQPIYNPQLEDSFAEFSDDGRYMFLHADITDDGYTKNAYRYVNGQYVKESSTPSLPYISSEFSYTYQELPQVGVRNFAGQTLIEDSSKDLLNDSLKHRTLLSGKNRDYVWVDTEKGVGYYFRIFEDEPCYNFFAGTDLFGEKEFRFSCPLEIGAALYEQDKLWMGYGDRVLRLEGSELP